MAVKEMRAGVMPCSGKTSGGRECGNLFFPNSAVARRRMQKTSGIPLPSESGKKMRAPAPKQITRAFGRSPQHGESHARI
jgi:hypothetical protein